MTLQNIRHYYEQPIVDWCATNAVELRADNMIDPGSDAASEFLVTRFNFGQFTEQLSILVLLPEGKETFGVVLVIDG